MTFLSARRALMVVASVAALLGLVSASSASAANDRLTQCAGSSIEGLGSSFQNPAEKVWTGTASPTLGFNVSVNGHACSGKQGSKGKPTVKYNQEETPTNNKGSGACLKDWGAGGAANVRLKAFPYCGTDEAPSATVEGEFEKTAETGFEEKPIETIPVAQGAVAVIVHLPAGCTATSEPLENKVTTKISRLSLENTTIEGIYRGTIKTWKAAVEAQKGSANDKLNCALPAEEEETIHVVIRTDKSGTTHIWKEFLAQVNTKPFTAETFNEITEGSKKSQPCKEEKKEEEKTWEQVGEGCENQRWPKEATVVRPPETGNPGVVKTTAETASSIGYADLAVAREKGNFSNEVEGGEGKARFWTPISNQKIGSKVVEYADPSTNGDTKEAANSNCKKSVYALKPGEKFPPPSTRDDWSKVKALYTSKTYPACGLTYVLAARQYFFFLTKQGVSEEESKKIATTVENFVRFALDTTSTGGGGELKGKDYEALSGTVNKEAVLGTEEIGSKIG